MAGERVRVPKTAELVADYVRRRIVRGDLQEGDALPPEAQLMEQFGISRPTLREAFRVLEAESLITVRRGSRGGARVRTPDIGVAARYTALLLQMRGVTLKDVHDTRLILEPAAVRRLAERPSKAAIAALEAVLKEEQETIGEPHGALALEFHEKLVELSGNETLALLAGMLHEIIEKHTAIAGSLEDRAPTGLSRNERRGTRAHARLLELIKARDAEQAERFWREHLEAAGQMMLREHGPKTVVDLMG